MKWRLLLFICLMFIVASTKVKAMSVSIQEFSVPSFINEETKTLQVTVSTSSSDSAYLRPVFFQTGTSNYFGCAMGLNVSSFVCSTTASDYPQITGSGTFTLSVKPDISSNYYSANANSDLSFKVRRCTSSCAGGDSDSNVIPVHFTTTTPTPSTPTPTPSATPSPSPQPTNIHLTEFVACPPSGNPEWIELYNDNSFDVTLTNWQMKDDKDNVSTINGNIGSKTYGVFDVHDLNNDIDTVRLYDGAGYSLPNETEHYDQCSSSMSWSKTSSGSWQQTPIITKGAANQFPTPIPSPTATPTPKPTATPIPTLDPTAEGADVLGESTSSGSEIPNLVVSDAAASEAASAANTPKESPIFAIASIGLGLVGLISLGGYLWYDWKKKKKIASPTNVPN